MGVKGNQEAPRVTQTSAHYLPKTDPTTAPRLRLCDLPTEERPLYRLHHHGSDALSTTELLALLLGSADAPGLAQELLANFGTLHRLARMALYWYPSADSLRPASHAMT
ncbi:MAG: hypothetical protein H6657_24625 [Ardenticatenaceae bacterium]|nr:hypothetical protein [Ardenticatenaceae bacterium]